MQLTILVKIWNVPEVELVVIVVVDIDVVNVRVIVVEFVVEVIVVVGSVVVEVVEVVVVEVAVAMDVMPAKYWKTNHLLWALANVQKNTFRIKRNLMMPEPFQKKEKYDFAYFCFWKAVAKFLMN